MLAYLCAQLSSKQRALGSLQHQLESAPEPDVPGRETYPIFFFFCCSCFFFLTLGAFAGCFPKHRGHNPASEFQSFSLPIPLCKEKDTLSPILYPTNLKATLERRTFANISPRMVLSPHLHLGLFFFFFFKKKMFY